MVVLIMKFQTPHPGVLVLLDQIEPPRRNATTHLFKNYKMVPVLFAFMSPECALPPVELNPSKAQAVIDTKSITASIGTMPL